MINRFSPVVAVLAVIGLSGCEIKSDAEDEQTGIGTVEREAGEDANAKAPADAPAQAATHAETQPVAGRQPLRVGAGPAGRDVALEQVNVAGDVLTVQVRYFMPNGEKGRYRTERFLLDEVSVIDDATAKELGVLQDNRGQFLAAPLDGDDKTEIELKLHGNPVVAWFKFPAPSAESTTVSINIPGSAPFDGVPINRY